MAKVLYISLDGMTESLGESQVIQYLLGLSKHNSIYLFSFEKKSNKDKRCSMKTRLTRANIQWKYFEYSNRFGVLSTFKQIFLAFFVLVKWIRKEKIQIIHPRGFVPAVISMLLKKISRVKILFDIRGFSIDEKIMHGRLKETSFFTTLLKKLELSVYKNSDHIVTLTHVSKPLIEKIFHVKPENISVIPTCANLDLFQPLADVDKLAFKKLIGFSLHDIIILRNGSFNGSYDIEAEFKLFAELMRLNSNIKLLFLNQGQHSLIKFHLEKYKIEEPRCKIFSIEFDKMFKYINLADLCIFFVKPSFSKQASAPTKFAELVACHLYSVTNTKYGDMEYYFNLYDVGILLDLEEVHLNPKKTADNVIQFLEKSKNQNNYQDFDSLFDKHFSKQIAIEKYQIIYSKLI